MKKGQTVPVAIETGSSETLCQLSLQWKMEQVQRILAECSGAVAESVLLRIQKEWSGGAVSAP